MYTSKDHHPKPPVAPRIIIHGGAGDISRSSLPPETYSTYRTALLTILSSASTRLSQPGATALDTAAYAVTQLENNPIFNAGHGAVFTTAGTHELEASVMVSRGYRKRGVGVMGVTRARNPILLAREVLVRGEEDGNEVGDGDGGAQGHSQLHGRTCDEFVRKWDLEAARPSYFFTRKSWVQHRKGLGLGCSEEEYQRAKRKADEDAGLGMIGAGGGNGDEDDEDRAVFGVDETTFQPQHPTSIEARIAGEDDEDEYDDFVPQGTVGCIVLDSSGTLCAATSTGGMTNKLPGRIGDTPTLGAGFWAEEWTSTTTHTDHSSSQTAEGAGRQSLQQFSIVQALPAAITDCLPAGLFSGYSPLVPSSSTSPRTEKTELLERSRPRRRIRAVAMSGTGNGDSFLRVNAVRTAAAMARWAAPGSIASQPSPCHYDPRSYSGGDDGSKYTSLQTAVTAMAGPGGVLEQSAEDRWETGEGQGGIIGIELDDGVGKVVFDYNCGGMFHAWVDDEGKHRFAVFQDEK